ncbi:translation initiation factor IF-2-like [Cebus imitator]|uniref:translation initiation factor IF-2-like n=1 Tax=Cebus imitator TaxID=2715852 RepID=UPI001898F279|nr:translation initiation factor IF-2-like [Cebus imitator]
MPGSSAEQSRGKSGGNELHPPLAQENTPAASQTRLGENSLPGSQIFKKCSQGRPGLRSDPRGKRRGKPCRCHPPPSSQKYFFQSQRRGHPSSKKGGGESVSRGKQKEISSGRDTGVPPPPPPLLSPPRLRRSAAGNAALAVAANAAAAAAKAPSRRVHSVSPGGCSGSPGTAPSSARPPASRSSRSSPSAAGPPPPPASAQPRARQLARAFVRSCSRAPAHPPSPRLARRALPPPRPRPPGSRGRLGSLLPRPLPSCRVCRKQKAGGWPRSRAQGMRAGAAGPAHWGRWGAARGVGAWRGPPAWGWPQLGPVGARGRGSRRMIRPVSAGTRAGPCSQPIPRAPPTSSSGHLLLDPVPPADQRPPCRETTRPQGCFLLTTCAAREGVQRRGTRGASLGGGRDWRRQNWERVPKRGPLLRGAQWEHQQAELETFPPRGTTVRGRVTPRPDDPWDFRLVFQRGTLGRTGGFGSGSARPSSWGPNLNLGGGRGRGAGLEGPGPAPARGPVRPENRSPCPAGFLYFWGGGVHKFFHLSPFLPPQCS